MCPAQVQDIGFSTMALAPASIILVEMGWKMQGVVLSLESEEQMQCCCLGVVMHQPGLKSLQALLFPPPIYSNKRFYSSFYLLA